MLDAICAFSTSDQTSKESERSKDIGKQIKHFSHRDPLTHFNYRKVRKYEYCCNWCEKPLSGMSYGCFCCQFFLHRFCLYKIPNRILEHPFHPLHPLYITFDDNSNGSICKACGDTFFRGSRYSCHKCNFHLHFLCSKLKPTLRHECHNHYLSYIVTTNRKAGFQCNKCNSFYEGRDEEEGTFYRCVQCNFNIHFKCLIPPTITHKYHRHSLTVTTSFIEDDSGEYYCDICEKQRNPKHHVYCCKECRYIAHIECALDKFVGTKFDCDSTSSLKYEEKQRSDADFPSHSLMECYTHKHPLRFKEVIRIEEYGNEKLLCRACELEICDQAYLCQWKECKYYLHKTCAELSFELLHPFHSYHPLFLCYWSKLFKCDKCQNVVFHGFFYCCFRCNFKVDIKCVVDTGSKIVNQSELKKIERPTATATNLLDFIHSHELHSVNCTPTYIRSFWCEACFSDISGPAYCCLECDFYIHETCLRHLPREIQIPSHPLHTLLPFPFKTDNLSSVLRKRCPVCKFDCFRFCYGCSPCDIYLHFSCAGSLKRPLSSKSHSHNLYLLERNKSYYISKTSKCGKCNKSFVEESIYRCIECDTNFHLKCAGISYKVKSKCHIHPLTLKNIFVEDDSEDYYCDICEEERDPKDDVYYCQECDGLFVAHIDCVVSAVEEVLQQ